MRVSKSLYVDFKDIHFFLSIFGYYNTPILFIFFLFLIINLGKNKLLFRVRANNSVSY